MRHQPPSLLRRLPTPHARRPHVTAEAPSPTQLATHSPPSLHHRQHPGKWESRTSTEDQGHWDGDDWQSRDGGHRSFPRPHRHLLRNRRSPSPHPSLPLPHSAGETGIQDSKCGETEMTRRGQKGLGTKQSRQAHRPPTSPAAVAWEASSPQRAVMCSSLHVRTYSTFLSRVGRFHDRCRDRRAPIDRLAGWLAD